MDTGKCIVLLVANPGTVFDYEDENDNWKRADSDLIAPCIAIPTTAGTGSEVGRAAVILAPLDKTKKIIFHPHMAPDLVLADPQLTVGLPSDLTAGTGMDAFAHCFEAYCGESYHPMADGIALEGMRLIADNLVVAFDDGDDEIVGGGVVLVTRVLGRVDVGGPGGAQRPRPAAQSRRSSARSSALWLVRSSAL